MMFIFYLISKKDTFILRFIVATKFSTKNLINKFKKIEMKKALNFNTINQQKKNFFRI